MCAIPIIVTETLNFALRDGNEVRSGASVKNTNVFAILFVFVIICGKCSQWQWNHIAVTLS